MNRLLFVLVVLSAWAQAAQAHIGSPNVFFEGKAGPYPAHVVIRPPSALPGAAQVSIQLSDPGISSVALIPVLYQAGRGASPSGVEAQRVTGETTLWTAEVWFLRQGSYVVQLRVEGAKGFGEATVPVNMLGGMNQQMKFSLRAILCTLGLFLLAGAVLIVSAVAREGRLEAGQRPAAIDYSRGKRGAFVAVLLLFAGVGALAARWRAMDLSYRTNSLQRPEPVRTEVRSEPGRVILELREPEQAGPRPSWGALVPDHGKLMHLFAIREPQSDVFAHLHPVRTGSDSFALVLPPVPTGSYQLYGDVTYENGLNQTLIARLNLPEPVTPLWGWAPIGTNMAGATVCGSAAGLSLESGEIARDLDDSWHTGGSETTLSGAESSPRILSSCLTGGYQLILENVDAVIGGREPVLRFTALAPDGSAALLQPYMGMLGHAAVRRADGSVFAHLHPAGTFSMASQELFRQRSQAADPQPGASNLATANSPNQPTNEVCFPYQFPKTGPYRIWVQVRIAGRVLTGVYDLESHVGS